MSHLDLAAYCERIAYEGPLEPALETLRGLTLAHACRVPYENLEIHLGRPMLLEDDALERQIVRDSRGGYCFQMNLLFARVLRAIGFPVKLLAGRGWLTSGGAVPPPAHLVLEVETEGATWLVDAGWGGGGLRAPLPMQVGAESVQGGRRYRLCDAGGFGSMLERMEGEKWVSLYSFERTPRHPVDFEHANYYLSHSPDSFFVQNRICTIATTGGETILFNAMLRIRSGDEVTERTIEGDDACRAVLREHFGIDLPEDARLRPPGGAAGSR